VTGKDLRMRIDYGRTLELSCARMTSMIFDFVHTWCAPCEWSQNITLIFRVVIVDFARRVLDRKGWSL
jgi:hypothetical protein